jgi:hypothetical protein
MMAYDKHLNVVLRDAEECRMIEGQMYHEPRGLIVIRGVNVQTIGADTLGLPDAQGSGNSLFQRGIGTVSVFRG